MKTPKTKRNRTAPSRNQSLHRTHSGENDRNAEVFRVLTDHGLKVLAQRLDDALGSVITTSETASKCGMGALVGKLSLMNTTLTVIRERVLAMRKRRNSATRRE